MEINNKNVSFASEVLIKLTDKKFTLAYLYGKTPEKITEVDFETPSIPFLNFLIRLCKSIYYTSKNLEVFGVAFYRNPYLYDIKETLEIGDMIKEKWDNLRGNDLPFTFVVITKGKANIYIKHKKNSEWVLMDIKSVNSSR